MSNHQHILSATAMTLIKAGILAADPVRNTQAAMAEVLRDPPGQGGVWRIIAVGKAARAMTQAALDQLPDARALVVTNAGNDAPLARAEIIVAGHPVPDAAGEQAARRVEDLLGAAGPNDRVLALISGGGSAMLPAPVEGVSLSEKQRVNRLLLASGADIAAVNLIRQSLSRLKGGGWLRICRAPVVSLILSDVPGNDLRVVASGPTVGPIGTIAEAAALTRELGIWDHMPSSVQVALGRRERPPLDAAPRNMLIGSNRQSVEEMALAGATTGPELTGDVEDCARMLVRYALKMQPETCAVFGGETTVRLTGDGMGGRNQELALRFARAAENLGLDGNWRFASVGSDGRDGPGDAAGGLVGPDTLALIRASGIDPEDALARNDSTPALQAAGALVMTGPTGTNVADLAVFVKGRDSR